MSVANGDCDNITRSLALSCDWHETDGDKTRWTCIPTLPLAIQLIHQIYHRFIVKSGEVQEEGTIILIAFILHFPAPAYVSCSMKRKLVDTCRQRLLRIIIAEDIEVVNADCGDKGLWWAGMQRSYQQPRMTKWQVVAGGFIAVNVNIAEQPCCCWRWQGIGIGYMVTAMANGHWHWTRTYYVRRRWWWLQHGAYGLKSGILYPFLCIPLFDGGRVKVGNSFGIVLGIVWLQFAYSLSIPSK